MLFLTTCWTRIPLNAVLQMCEWGYGLSAFDLGIGRLLNLGDITLASKIPWVHTLS